MLGNAFHPFTTLQECNLDWILTKVKNILRFVPDDGAVGQILRRTRDGAEWSDESQSGAVDSVNGQTGEVVLTKSDIGLGNVDNVQQYSASNPPPYPVTSVNGQTGDVTVSGSGAVDSVNGQTGDVVLTKSDIGLGNVDNVQQYSASNPPPYPVTSVNGQTGDVTVSGGGAVDSVNGQTGDVVLTKSDIGLGNVDNVQQYSASNPPPYPVTSILDAYPVGSIYISTHNTDPSILFGGTWTKLEDTFLLATGPTYSAGSRGGEATHTLTESELPSISGTVGFRPWNTGSQMFSPSGAFSIEDGGTAVGSASSGSSNTSKILTMEFGSGQAHNNMPPYLAVYMWYRRT